MSAQADFVTARVVITIERQCADSARTHTAMRSMSLRLPGGTVDTLVVLEMGDAIENLFNLACLRYSKEACRPKEPA